jgi:hypothetical protein
VSARPHSASCLGKGLDCNATLVKFPSSCEPAVSSVISGLRLCLPSRLATVDEFRRATATREKDSKQRERIEVIPFTREEKWFFAEVSQGMHEMDKCEAVCFRARQNPCAERSKDLLNSGES